MKYVLVKVKTVKNSIIILGLILIVTYPILEIIRRKHVNEDTILTRVSNELNWNNTLTISGKGLDLNLVDVYWKGGEYKTFRKVLAKKKQIAKIENRYGIHYFQVVLPDSTSFVLEHYFNSNSWHTYAYHIYLKKDEQEGYYVVSFNADGPDEQYFQKKFDFSGKEIETVLKLYDLIEEK